MSPRSRVSPAPPPPTAPLPIQQRYWYARLKAEGFRDIEFGVDTLKKPYWTFPGGGPREGRPGVRRSFVPLDFGVGVGEATSQQERDNMDAYGSGAGPVTLFETPAADAWREVDDVAEHVDDAVIRHWIDCSGCRQSWPRLMRHMKVTRGRVAEAQDLLMSYGVDWHTLVSGAHVI